MARHSEQAELDQQPAEAADPAAVRSRWHGIAWGLFILIATLLAYGPALRGTFLWDDGQHFSENPYMEQPGGLKDLWVGRVLYYPLTSTTFWVARRLWGLEPLPYHLLNVVLHAANAILLWRLLRRLRVRGAWLAGGLFALHPVAVQSVAWMTELKNVQSGLFYLLALHGWVSWRERSQPQSLPRASILHSAFPIPHSAFPLYAAALACFALALLSKTSTVTLPLALLVIETWRRERPERKTVAAWIPFLALSALAGLLTVHYHKSMVGGAEWNETFPERLILAGRCVWFYLAKLFYPVHLTFVYPRWSVDARSAAQWLWPAALALLFIALWIGRRQPGGRATLLALLYYAASLAPVLNFFRMYYTRYAYAADHWQYLAMMGGVAWIAGGLAWLSRLGRMRITRALPLLVLAVLGALTWEQAWVYRDPVRLWNHVLTRNPSAAIAYNNLAIHFMMRGGADPRNFQVARRVLEEGLKVNPGNQELLTLHGANLVYLDRPAEALAVLERARQAGPQDDPAVLNYTGMALEKMGKIEEAESVFARALRARPDFPDTYFHLAQMLNGAGRKDEARRVAERGLSIAPGRKELLELRAELSGR